MDKNNVQSVYSRTSFSLTKSVANERMKKKKKKKEKKKKKRSVQDQNILMNETYCLCFFVLTYEKMREGVSMNQLPPALFILFFS